MSLKKIATNYNNEVILHQRNEMYYQLSQNSLTEIYANNKTSEYGGSSSFIYKDGKLLKKKRHKEAMHNRGYMQNCHQNNNTAKGGNPAHTQSVARNIRSRFVFENYSLF